LYYSIFVLTYTLKADDLANILQDLAVQIACLGRYSNAEAGVNVISRYNDPTDWYQPPMLANRFAAMSGNMTRTITFYGVCFDYAQFAWDDIKKYQKMYNNAGMKDKQWYIASTKKDNPYNIILYDPVSKEKSTIIMNGIYLKENSRYNVYAHDGATGHAWIWVQHINGTWYWIDPTWTDNTGYVWWGIVKDGREIQYDPEPKYCVASNYPKKDIAKNETRSSNQNNNNVPSYSPSNSNYYSPSNSHYLMIGYNHVNGMPYGITIADSMFFDKSLIYISANLGFDSLETTEGSIYSYRNINWSLMIIEWIYGFSIAINEYFRIPIGIGGNHTLLSPTEISSSNYHSTEEPEEKWQHRFVFEIGVQPVLFKRIALTATYRLKGFSEGSFATGIGVIF